MTVSLILLVY